MTVTGYDVSLFLHITAVVIGLGSTFVEGLTFPVAMRLDPRHLPYKHRLQLAIHRFLTLPALVVVLATGFYFIPEDRRLEAMVRRHIAASGSGAVTLSDEYQRRVRIEAAMGGFASLLVIAAVYLMVTKPGL